MAETVKNQNNEPPGGMFLLPPRSDLCQECATKHEPEMPHNQQSLYYQMAFKIKHGRSPTWADAMAHCSDEMKAVWTEELRKLGVEVAG